MSRKFEKIVYKPSWRDLISAVSGAKDFQQPQPITPPIVRRADWL
jgi:hypothetical protein